MGWAIDCIEVGMGWDMCLMIIVVVIIISLILIVLGLVWGWDMCYVIIVVVIIVSLRCGGISYLECQCENFLHVQSEYE